MSRFCDIDDWGISQYMADEIMSEFGNCDVDLCASSANTKCSRFVSRWADPRSEAVDCLASFELVATEHKLAWLVPPPKLIPKLIHLSQKFRLSFILGCPFWQSHYFFPVLRDKNEWRNFVKKVRVIKTGVHFIEPGPGSAKGQLFANSALNFDFLFLHCEFK